MQESEITTTNNYEYLDKVCFNGYLARECFGAVYDIETGENGLMLLSESIGQGKFDRIVYQHLNFIDGSISFDTAKRNVLKILSE